MTDTATVLIVDDDPAMQELLANALADTHRTIAVASGQACLEAVAAHRPDVVLLDVEMPELDGYATCRRLKGELDDAPPVLFVSSHDELEARLRGYEAGGDDYLCKPILAPELAAKIERQLAATSERRRLGQQLEEAVSAVMSSADMAGAVGVVLQIQREMWNCRDYAALADKVFEALATWGLEGCLRLAGRLGTRMRNLKGPCTALESSILERLIQQPADPRIRPVGPHTSFNFGSLLLFVRNLPMERDPGMDPALAEQHGRNIDHVALLLEAAAARMSAIDAESLALDLGRLRRIASTSTVALSMIERQDEESEREFRRSFESMLQSVEDSFIQLGLTHSQEDRLSDLLKSHASAVERTLSRSKGRAALMRRVISELRQYADDQPA